MYTKSQPYVTSWIYAKILSSAVADVNRSAVLSITPFVHVFSLRLAGGIGGGSKRLGLVLFVVVFSPYRFFKQKGLLFNIETAQMAIVARQRELRGIYLNKSILLVNCKLVISFPLTMISLLKSL